MFILLLQFMSIYCYLVIAIIFQLLESMMKNCGEVVHAYVAEKDVLKEMGKVVKKKASFSLLDKVVLLINFFILSNKFEI